MNYAWASEGDERRARDWEGGALCVADTHRETHLVQSPSTAQLRAGLTVRPPRASLGSLVY